MTDVWHPLAFVEQVDRGDAIRIMLVLSALAAIVMGRVGRDMRARGGRGIVALELARDVDEARALTERWGDEGVSAARRSIAVDFAFVPLYSAALSFACLYVGDVVDARGWGAWAAAGDVLTWGVLVAGALDLLENVAMLRTLGSGPTPAGVAVTRASAALKFGLLAVAAAYCACVRTADWLL